MQSEITIRAARPEDIDSLIDVNIRAWHTTYRGIVDDETLDAMTSDSLKDKWERTVRTADSEDRFCFLAQSQEDIVGYVVCGKNREAEASFEWQLYAIYVLQEYQRKGIGRLLFDVAIKEMKRRAVPSFMLYVLEDNRQACRFYESLGPSTHMQHLIEIGGRCHAQIGYGWSQMPI